MDNKGYQNQTKDWLGFGNAYEKIMRCHFHFLIFYCGEAKKTSKWKINSYQLTLGDAHGFWHNQKSYLDLAVWYWIGEKGICISSFSSSHLPIVRWQCCLDITSQIKCILLKIHIFFQIQFSEKVRWIVRLNASLI